MKGLLFALVASLLFISVTVNANCWDGDTLSWYGVDCCICSGNTVQTCIDNEGNWDYYYCGQADCLLWDDNNGCSAACGLL